MRDKKVTGHSDVPGDVPKLLGEGAVRLITQLIYNICETGVWPKDFTEVTVFVSKAIKWSDYHSIGLTSHFTLSMRALQTEQVWLKSVNNDGQFTWRSK
jgi:hypothetical protein